MNLIFMFHYCSGRFTTLIKSHNLLVDGFNGIKKDNMNKLFHFINNLILCKKIILEYFHDQVYDIYIIKTDL